MGLDKANQTSFKKGHIPAKPFIKGNIPWNKGLIGIQAGSNAANWKGGLPDCTKCGKQLSQRHSKTNLCMQCFFQSEIAKKQAISNLPAPLKKEKNPNWKGGTYGTERHREMGRIEYKLWRAEVFERDNYTCRMCFAKGVYLNADHIKSWAEFPELRYEISNGQTLCNNCHYFKTFGRQITENIQWGTYNKKERVQA